MHALIHIDSLCGGFCPCHHRSTYVDDVCCCEVQALAAALLFLGVASGRLAHQVGQVQLNPLPCILHLTHYGDSIHTHGHPKRCNVLPLGPVGATRKCQCHDVKVKCPLVTTSLRSQPLLLVGPLIQSSSPVRPLASPLPPYTL